MEALSKSIVGLALMLAASPVQAQVHTTIDSSLPSLTPEQKGPDDPDAIYCRPPQHQTDSRLLGPKVCMTNRKWDNLHAQGLDMSADGTGVVASEKYLSTHPCNMQHTNCY
jgi:hypothetical protein